MFKRRLLYSILPPSPPPWIYKLFPRWICHCKCNICDILWYGPKYHGVRAPHLARQKSSRLSWGQTVSEIKTTIPIKWERWRICYKVMGFCKYSTDKSWNITPQRMTLGNSYLLSKTTTYLPLNISTCGHLVNCQFLHIAKSKSVNSVHFPLQFLSLLRLGVLSFEIWCRSFNSTFIAFELHILACKANSSTYGATKYLQISKLWTQMNKLSSRSARKIGQSFNVIFIHWTLDRVESAAENAAHWDAHNAESQCRGLGPTAELYYGDVWDWPSPPLLNQESLVPFSYIAMHQHGIYENNSGEFHSAPLWVDIGEVKWAEAAT